MTEFLIIIIAVSVTIMFGFGCLVVIGELIMEVLEDFNLFNLLATITITAIIALIWIEVVIRLWKLYLGI